MSTKKEKGKSNSNNSIQLFYYKGLSVRTVNIDGEIWFVAKDIADILGYSDATHATRYLDDDEKALFNTSENKLLIWESIQECDENQTTRRGNPNIVIITEPGLYELVFRNNKPDAKAFSRWVRHDVLPSIRRTGSYSVDDMNRNDDVTIQRRLLMRQEKEAIQIRKTFWERMFKAVKAIDNVMLSNGPVPVNGIPRGLALDSSHIRLTEKIKRFLQECIQEKINSLEAEERAISVLTNR